MEKLLFSIDPYLTEQNTGVIDYHYMNSRFEKWKKKKTAGSAGYIAGGTGADPGRAAQIFCVSFSGEQKYANLFLHDVQTGDVKLQEGVTFQDYIYRYVNHAKQEQIRRLHKYFGLREDLVSQLLERNVTKENLNEYGRFDALKATVVKEKAAEYFTRLDGKKMPMFRVNNRGKCLTDRVLSGRRNGYSGTAGRGESGSVALHLSKKRRRFSYA